jgi:hypothetical protein
MTVKPSLLLITILLCANATAQTVTPPPSPLHKEYACVTCHMVQPKDREAYLRIDRLAVIPKASTYHDLAIKYKADPGAKQRLTSKIFSGTGHLKTQASEADVAKMIDDILATP